ncbi:MAG: amino acid racemase [Ruminococcaceae bacterium]|nr:amino acid racemase [Oscillospiraceae bacterium]
METKTLGILGGVGPLASVRFSEMMINMTDAKTDQEHIPLLMFNDNTIPDRTSFILGRSNIDPVPKMISGIKKLVDFGSNYIVITCNTAHYFYDQLQASTSVPIVNMIEEAVTAAILKKPGVKKIGVLATDGTVESGVYAKVIEERGLTCVVPSKNSQSVVMDIIYNQVKAGKDVDVHSFLKIIDELRHFGCDVIILGCTELSVINSDNNLTLHSGDIVDAMEALAQKCITLCGKKVK